MLPFHTSRNLHESVKIQHLLLWAATPVLFSVMEHRFSFVIRATSIHILLRLIPLIAAHVKTLHLSVYTSHTHPIPTLHWHRLWFRARQLFDRLHSARSIWIALVKLIDRANNGRRSGSRCGGSDRRGGSTRSSYRSIDGSNSGRRGERLQLLLTRMRTDRATLDLVELVPVIHASIWNSTNRNYF